MEDKQTMIEDWCKKVEHYCKSEFSEKAAKEFMAVCLNSEKIDNNETFIDDLNNKKCGIGSAFWLRVKHLHTYSVTPSLTLFLMTNVLENFGISTMMAAYLQYIAWKKGVKTIGITEWSQWAFPMGLPTENDWNRLWDEQKIPFSMRGPCLTDNMLDCPSVFGKSIWDIKER